MTNCTNFNNSVDFSSVKSFAKSMSDIYDTPVSFLEYLFNQENLNRDTLTDILVNFLNLEGIQTKRNTPKDSLINGKSGPVYSHNGILHIDTIEVNSLAELTSQFNSLVPDSKLVDFMSSVFGVSDYNLSFDSVFNDVKSKIKQESTKEERKSKLRKPIIYAAPGLGKTYLSDINGAYIDADKIAVQTVQEILGTKVSPVEASTILGKNSSVASRFKLKIRELSKTHTILSSMDSSKLGIPYDKEFIPDDSILPVILDNIKNRKEFPFSISEEKYRELYMNGHKGTKIKGTLSDVFTKEEEEFTSSMSSFLLSKITELPFTFSLDKIEKGFKKITSRASKYRSGFYSSGGKHFSVYALTTEPLSFIETLDYLKDSGYLPEEGTREEYFRLFGVKEEELDSTNDSFQHYMNWVNGVGKRYTYSISPVSSLFTVGSETLNEENIEKAAKELMRQKMLERITERTSELRRALRNKLTLKNEDSLEVQSIRHKLDLYTQYKKQLKENPDLDLSELILSDLIGYTVNDYSDVEFLTQEYEFLKTLMELEDIEPSESKLKLLDSLKEHIDKEDIIQATKLFKDEYNKDFDDVTPVDDTSVLKGAFISFREASNEILQLIGQKVNKGISEVQDLVNKFRSEHNRVKANLLKHAPNDAKDQSWLINKELGTFYTKYEKGLFVDLKKAKDLFSFKELSKFVSFGVSKSLTEIKTQRSENNEGYYDDLIIKIKEQLNGPDELKFINSYISALRDTALRDEIIQLKSEIEATENPNYSEVKAKIIEGKEIEFKHNKEADLIRVETLYNAVKNGTLETLLASDSNRVNLEKTFFYILHHFDQNIHDTYYSKEYRALLNDTSMAGKAKLEYYEFFTEFIRSAEVTEKLPFGKLPSFYKTQDVRKLSSWRENIKRSLSEREDKVIHRYNKVTGGIEQDFGVQGLNSLPIEDMDLDMFSVLEKFSESLSNAIIRNKYRNQLLAAKSLLKRQLGIRKDKWGKPLLVDNDDKQLTNAIIAADSVLDSFLYGQYKDVDGVLVEGILDKDTKEQIKELEDKFNALNFTQEEKDRIRDVNMGKGAALSDRELKGLSIYKEVEDLKGKSKVITGRKLTDSALSFTTLLRLGFSPLGLISESIQAWMGSFVEGKSSIIKYNDIVSYLKTNLTRTDKEFTEKMDWVSSQFIMESFLKGGVENNKFMEQALWFYKAPNDIFNKAYLYSFLKNKEYNGKPLWDQIEKRNGEYVWSEDSNMVKDNEFTDNKYTYQEEFRLILRKTRERQQSTDPIQSHKTFWGRLLNQFKGTWLYEGFYYRYGKGTNVYLGKVDGETQYKNTEGFYRTAFNYLSTPGEEQTDLLGNVTLKEVNNFKRTLQTIGSLIKMASWDKIMGNDYTRDNELSPEVKDNIKKAVADIQLKLMIGMILTSFIILGGDDKRKKKEAGTLYKLCFNTLVRVNSDATIYSSPASFMNTIKNAIPVLSTVKQINTLFVTDTYKTIIGDPFYHAGTKRETLRQYSDVKRLVPIVTTIENLEQFLTEKSKNY